MNDSKKKGPAWIKTAPGFYKWCTCGFSKTQPFCDHSHRTEAPGMHSLKIEIMEEANLAWCVCKKTKTPPFCDGSHTHP